MYELECLRRRMEDKVEKLKKKEAIEEIDMDKVLEEVGMEKHENNNGSALGHKVLEDIIDDVEKLNDEEKDNVDEDDEFTGQSCLLVTWKTNPEVERFKDLYMEESVKTHKRKSKNLVDPGDLVSEKSLVKSYKILGQVDSEQYHLVVANIISGRRG